MLWSTIFGFIHSARETNVDHQVFPRRTSSIKAFFSISGGGAAHRLWGWTIISLEKIQIYSKCCCWDTPRTHALRGLSKFVTTSQQWRYFQANVRILAAYLFSRWNFTFSRKRTALLRVNLTPRAQITVSLNAVKRQKRIARRRMKKHTETWGSHTISKEIFLAIRFL